MNNKVVIIHEQCREHGGFQMRGRPERFGETNPIELEIIDQIIFARQVKRQTFQGIAIDLNSQGRWPRRAKEWTWDLVRHVFVGNTKPGIKGGTQ
jgi:hypothetical protein